MAISFPASPTEGQVHNVSAGVSFVYRGEAWVPAPMTTALPKNYIVNPAMQLGEQNGVTSGMTDGYYTADQWMLSYVATASNIASSRTANNAIPRGSAYCIYFNCDTGA